MPRCAFRPPLTPFSAEPGHRFLLNADTRPGPRRTGPEVGGATGLWSVGKRERRHSPRAVSVESQRRRVPAPRSDVRCR